MVIIHCKRQNNGSFEWEIFLKYKKLNVCDSPDDGPGGPKHVAKRGSEKCQNKHSIAIAGIDLCHIYIYIFLQQHYKFCHLNFDLILYIQG
jgi:hypothetical protein